MAYEQQIQADFDKAYWKGFWRTVGGWLVGQNNELLPFDKLQSVLPTNNQSHKGVRQVPVANVAGSVGRYRDFDRAFLPRRRVTRDRWLSINRAHYEDVILPPVELYKIGDIYFVKDGNHRVSVARERGQEWIDAAIIEIETPIPITPETNLDELIRQQDRIAFLAETRIAEIRPEAHIELSLPGQYEKLLEHIRVHQWYLGVEQQREIPFHEAVGSWYDRVYLPLVTLIRERAALREFPGRTESDLYLWIIEHQWYLHEQEGLDPSLDQLVTEYAEAFSTRPFRRLGKALNTMMHWLSGERREAQPSPMADDRAAFLTTTRLAELRPDADPIELTSPGQYETLMEHILAHQWYLGVEQQREILFQEAVMSWYDTVYQPLVTLIRERGLVREFPERTESDLYLSITEHQWYLREQQPDGEITMETAINEYATAYSERPLRRVVRAFSEAMRRSAEEMADAGTLGMPLLP